jgi:hypothetical protein
MSTLPELPESVRRRALDREPVCRICGEAPSEQVDYIMPRVWGVSDDLKNLQGPVPTLPRQEVGGGLGPASFYAGLPALRRSSVGAGVWY